MQVAIDIFRDLPYLAMNGIILLWYLYQVVIGIHKAIQNRSDDSGSHVTPKFMHKVCMNGLQVKLLYSFHLLPHPQ